MSRFSKIVGQIYTSILLGGAVVMAFIPRLWKGILAMILIATLGVFKVGTA